MFSSTKEKTRSATQKIILSENFFVEFRGYIKKNPSTSQRMQTCWKVFCHLHMMELTIIFWFKVDNCLTFMSCDCVAYYLISRWWLRPFVRFNRTNIIHTFLINTITWFLNSFFDLTGSTRKRSANNILNTLFIFINDQLIDWSTTNSEKRVIYILLLNKCGHRNVLKIKYWSEQLVPFWQLF